MAIARIRKNDTVICTCGNDAGKTGTVMKIDPKKGVAIVGGLNVHKKAMRRTEKTAGGLIDKELPIRLCKPKPMLMTIFWRRGTSILLVMPSFCSSSATMRLEYSSLSLAMMFRSFLRGPCRS